MKQAKKKKREKQNNSVRTGNIRALAKGDEIDDIVLHF